jgi:hypothetical protein
VALYDRKRAIGKQTGQKLVDSRLAQLGLMGELLTRDALSRQIVPDFGRDPLLLVHHRPAPARSGASSSIRKEQENSGDSRGKVHLLDRSSLIEGA